MTRDENALCAAWWIVAAAVVAVLCYLFVAGCSARRAATVEDYDELTDTTPTQAELDQAVRDALGELYPARHATRAKWNGKRFVCPAGTDLWASEHDALAGRKNFVYCVKGR
jgi:hypothetical protein